MLDHYFCGMVETSGHYLCSLDASFEPVLPPKILAIRLLCCMTVFSCITPLHNKWIY